MHLGNDFLEEAAKECFKHLKPEGKVYWVVQKHLRPIIERLLTSVFGNFEIIARGQEHILFKAKK